MKSFFCFTTIITIGLLSLPTICLANTAWLSWEQPVSTPPTSNTSASEIAAFKARYEETQREFGIPETDRMEELSLLKEIISEKCTDLLAEKEFYHIVKNNRDSWEDFELAIAVCSGMEIDAKRLVLSLDGIKKEYAKYNTVVLFEEVLNDYYRNPTPGKILLLRFLIRKGVSFENLSSLEQKDFVKNFGEENKKILFTLK